MCGAQWALIQLCLTATQPRDDRPVPCLQSFTARHSGPACPRTLKSPSAASFLDPLDRETTALGSVQVREEGVIFVQHGDHRRAVGGLCRDRCVLSAPGRTEVLNGMKMSDSGPISFSVSRPRSSPALTSPAVAPPGRGRAGSPSRHVPSDGRPPDPSAARRPGPPRKWSARPHCGPRRGRRSCG
jgi:hypothetical protein